MLSPRVHAIVVSFNPDLVVIEQLLLELQLQGCEVLLVDNASSNIKQLEQLTTSMSSVETLSLQQNLGLGSAHNMGIKHARSAGSDYVLIMDQDSLPMANMVNELVRLHQTKSIQSKVSAIGTSYLNSENGSRSFFVRFGALKFQRHYCALEQHQIEYNCDAIEADFLISSGSLIALSTLDDVGEMDEGLFIDHVDTEWFLRARSMGYQAFGSCKALMGHGLGENTHQVNLGGRKRNVPQHKPFRYYYIFRNSILLYKRSYASALWKWNDIQRLGMIFVMFGFIVGPRRQNLTMMLKGVFHGLSGKQGADYEH